MGGRVKEGMKRGLLLESVGAAAFDLSFAFI
jgi:hypothetical protein